MKLVLQIALGVFLGMLSSHLVIDSWHTHQEVIAKEAAEKFRAKQEKVRMEQGDRIRTLLMQSRQNKTHGENKPPVGFVPDDAKVP
jgi:hypothetical protein